MDRIPVVVSVVFRGNRDCSFVKQCRSPECESLRVVYLQLDSLQTDITG